MSCKLRWFTSYRHCHVTVVSDVPLFLIAVWFEIIPTLVKCAAQHSRAYYKEIVHKFYVSFCRNEFFLKTVLSLFFICLTLLQRVRQVSVELFGFSMLRLVYFPLYIFFVHLFLHPVTARFNNVGPVTLNRQKVGDPG